MYIQDFNNLPTVSRFDVITWPVLSINHIIYNFNFRTDSYFCSQTFYMCIFKNLKFLILVSIQSSLIVLGNNEKNFSTSDEFSSIICNCLPAAISCTTVQFLTLIYSPQHLQTCTSKGTDI